MKLAGGVGRRRRSVGAASCPYQSSSPRRESASRKSSVALSPSVDPDSSLRGSNRQMTFPRRLSTPFHAHRTRHTRNAQTRMTATVIRALAQPVGDALPYFESRVPLSFGKNLLGAELLRRVQRGSRPNWMPWQQLGLFYESGSRRRHC
jgi:hypothetical protein